MKTRNLFGIITTAWAAVMLLTLNGAAATPDVGNKPVQVTVTASGRGQEPPPVLTRRDVIVFQDNQWRPVLDLTPIGSSARGTDLAILIDGSLRSKIGLQFNDLKKFMQALPASTAIGVAYAEYGSARFAQSFTADHKAAEAALRLPEGSVNVGGSIYQSVADLARHWPDDGRARSAFVVSDGLDINRGLSETLPTLNPDLAEAISESQKAGVTVYAIYANGATRLTRDLFLLDNGQSSLTRLASETGGESYFQGDETPVSFQPFLKQLRETLGRQYVLTFEAAPNDQGSLRVSTEIPHVRIDAPARVWPGERK